MPAGEKRSLSDAPGPGQLEGPPGELPDRMGLPTHSGTVSPEAERDRAHARVEEDGTAISVELAPAGAGRAPRPMRARRVPRGLERAHAAGPAAARRLARERTDRLRDPLALGVDHRPRDRARHHRRHLRARRLAAAAAPRPRAAARRLAIGEMGVRVDPERLGGRAARARSVFQPHGEPPRRDAPAPRPPPPRAHAVRTRCWSSSPPPMASPSSTTTATSRSSLARGQARGADRRAALPAAGGRGRLQAAQRPARPQRGRPRAPGDRARDAGRRSARPTTSRATEARSSCCCCPRPPPRAARPSPRRCAARSRRSPHR